MVRLLLASLQTGARSSTEPREPGRAAPSRPIRAWPARRVLARRVPAQRVLPQRVPIGPFLAAALWLAASAGAACSPGTSPQDGVDAGPVSAGASSAGAAAGAAEPLPDGGGLPERLPERLEDMLTGSARACRRDAECASRVCYYGTCMGALLIDQRWRQQRATAPLVRAVAGDPALRERLVRRLGDIFHRPGTDLAYRARALLVLEALGERPPLVRALEAPSEALQAVAALSLARLGDPRGLPLTRALTESDSRAVAMEALHALGASRRPEVLPDLLAWLDEGLDRERVRAAVVAVGELGDPRAVRPLVAFLRAGPAYLRVRVATVLRSLTGARLGEDPAAWEAWVGAHAPPEAPPYRLHKPDVATEFGLPEP